MDQRKRLFAVAGLTVFSVGCSSNNLVTIAPESWGTTPLEVWIVKDTSPVGAEKGWRGTEAEAGDMITQLIAHQWKFAKNVLFDFSGQAKVVNAFGIVRGMSADAFDNAVVSNFWTADHIITPSD